MNAIDYFFENTSRLDKLFLAGKEEITYKNLYKESLKLASWIRKEIGTGNNIIILSVNNLFMLKTYLAVIKSENVCIPLDPRIEQDNFDYIAKLTEPSMILLTEDIMKRLPLGDYRCILPSDIADIEEYKESDLNYETDSEECAEIIFTSGSTGEPKGVMISHKNLIANTSSIVEYLQLTADDRMLVVLPFYYCYGLSLLHTHLRVGGSIVFNNSFIFLGRVIQDLIDYECTGFAGIPSHFQILLRKSDTFKETSFPHLKYVTQAGGKLASIFMDEFREAHPEIRFTVMYGQTEATARLSWLPPELLDERRGSMGKGIPGVELRVVNEKGEKIKPGEIGEVVAKGDNVMMGYFHDEEGTKKALRNGWLYTGDLGTVDEDGYIYLTARSKEIIKVRGKRVSPKEIEAVILEIPGIIDCTISSIDDEIEGEKLKATVVIRKDYKNSLTGEVIQQHCSQHLALFKIPQVFDLKDELTITATGKKIKKMHAPK
ncbi:MAG: AMP-binding protein [Bacteroidales bacterium]|nr:AMP-binding protein [Bacteroidales bacterium]